MKLSYKRTLKFVTLLITALLIATASATVYKYMFIDGSITVGGAQMEWILGTDAPSDASISGTTATTDLDVEQGTPTNFTEALFLKNINATGSFSFNINVTTAVATGDFERAKMHIYENYSAPSWTYLDTLDLTNDADYYSSSLAAGNYLRMTFEVNATQSSGSYNFDVKVQYWAP